MPVQTTTANGSYYFNNVSPGTYKVVVNLPSGYIVSIRPGAGSRTNKATADGARAVIGDVTVTLDGSDVLWQNFGFVRSRTINGRAWYDTDSDGMIESGETRASGLTVRLYQNSDTTYTTPVNNIYGSPLVTTTNSSGVYSFSAVPTGTYKAIITMPSGQIVTVKNHVD